MNVLTLEVIAKDHGFSRFGMNATMNTGKSRFLCEAWGDDFKFVSAYGATEIAAANRAVRAAHAKRKELKP